MKRAGLESGEIRALVARAVGMCSTSTTKEGHPGYACQECVISVVQRALRKDRAARARAPGKAGRK